MAKSVTLYFGSFNPIHNGHRAVAKSVIDSSLADEVWFVVSPQNPHKESSELISEIDRYNMVQLAIEEWRLKASVSDVEFTMDKPSYTAKTLERLREIYPDITFSLLMGEDNILSFDRWYRWEEIAIQHEIFIYPRACETDSEAVSCKIESLTIMSGCPSLTFRYLYQAPKVDVSSSKIREKVANGDIVGGMTSGAVIDYILKNELYDR